MKRSLPPHPELVDHAIALDDAAFETTLVKLVEDADVVLLGESHHFVHESFEVRTTIVEILGQAGFTTIGLEVSPHDGRRFQAYLATGEASALDQVALFGAQGDPRRQSTGILAIDPKQYPHRAMRHETTRWLDRLRATSPAWRIFGFDVEYDVELAQADPPPQPEERERFRRTIDTSVHYRHAIEQATAYDQLAEPMAWREDLMARHVKEQKQPGERLILIGHNLHLTAGTDLVHLDGAIGPGGGRTPTLGHQLAADGIAGPCVWILHDHGHDSGPPPATGAITTVPGSLNEALAAIETPTAMLTAGVAILDLPWTIATMYGSTITAIPQQMCDLIISIPTTTRLRTS